jgi:hypothetical protein
VASIEVLELVQTLFRFVNIIASSGGKELTVDNIYPNIAHARRVKLQSFRFRVEPSTNIGTGKKMARGLRKFLIIPLLAEDTSVVSSTIFSRVRSGALPFPFPEARFLCSWVVDSGNTKRTRHKLMACPESKYYTYTSPKLACLKSDCDPKCGGHCLGLRLTGMRWTSEECDRMPDKPASKDGAKL